MAEPNLTSVGRVVDWLLILMIGVNLVLALAEGDAIRAGSGWLVAGICWLQAQLWRSSARAYQEVARHGRT